MIEEVNGYNPHQGLGVDEMVAGAVLVQYDKNEPDIAIGITLNRASLEKYLLDNPEPEGIGTPANPDNGLSFYVRLQRPQTNRLVRLIRKARDTTFGRDE